MSKKTFGLAVAMMLCLTVSFAQAQRGGKPGGKEGNKQGRGEPSGKAPGGNWSESKQQSQNGQKEAGAAGAEKNKQSQPSGGERAAAGAAASNRNEPKSSGADGAAARAAAANRNAPKASGAEGAAFGAAAANRRGPQASEAEGAAAGYAVVGRSFDRPDLYGQAWRGSNPNSWSGAGWAASTAWTPTAWNAVAGLCGYGNNTPLSFDYGSNVTCLNGKVVQDGNEIGTAEEFSQQASDLANEGADAQTQPEEKWLPLGVFAMVQNEQQHPHLILQIAINEKGALRGNYTDTVTDNTLPIQGGADQKTQRAAWTVGTNANTVLEAGLSNLTQGHAPALLHKNGKTERWNLVRLSQPE